MAIKETVPPVFNEAVKPKPTAAAEAKAIELINVKR